MRPPCIVDGCDKPNDGRGLCSTHWKRLRNSPEWKPLQRPTEAERFWAKVDKAEGCWLWTATISPDGYGQFRTGNQLTTAHRYSYAVSHGDIPAGHQLDHLCRVRHCVNPEHLEAVTSAENTYRGESPSAKNARRTTCVRGHEFAGDNLIITERGWRSCRACRDLRNRAVRDEAARIEMDRLRGQHAS